MEPKPLGVEVRVSLRLISAYNFEFAGSDETSDEFIAIHRAVLS
jgi:hypothetical protein